MQSLNLLPALQELPAAGETQGRDTRGIIRDLADTDKGLYAAEFAVGVSAGLWTIFDDINVDDNLEAAYEAAYPNLAGEHSLHEHWQGLVERGPASETGFVSGLQGKLAEIETKNILEANGYTNVEIAPDPTQPVWDISAIAPDGSEALIQVKSGAAAYAAQSMDAMDAAPDISFAVSDEIYGRILETVPEYADQVLLNIGSAAELTDSVQDNLGILANNMGLDIPDGIGEIIPYAGAIIAGARLVHSVLKTEREFKAADRTAKNKIQVVQSLTLMSRMGINTVLATVGGSAGTAAGSFLPGLGNIIGGIGGAIGGAAMGMYLNRHLQPHMLSVALNITGLTQDDLFYYKNKGLIDQTALSFRATASELEKQPPLPALLTGTA